MTIKDILTYIQHGTTLIVPNNKLYVETAKNSKKVENLRRRDNVIYYCVDVPCLPYKGVRGKGRVRIHVDVNHNIPIAEKIMVRYLKPSASHCNIHYEQCQEWRFSYFRNYTKLLFNMG